MNSCLLRLAVTLLCCAAMPVTPAAAQTAAARSFDLPAEPLGRALARFTRMTGVIVVADAALTRGQRSGAVRGIFTTEAALDQLLRGTGLRASPDGRSGFILVRESATASSPVESAVPAPDILVYGRLAKDTTLSIPQSVDILDSALIESSESETVGDVLRFVPGASRDGSPLDAFGDSYLIRGFPANQTVNGISANTLRQARDSIVIERVEVLKGPASVLYGQLQPGAVVNIVTKQPQRTWKGSASLGYGRFDDWRGTVDLTGPLDADGAVRFRLTGAYDDADSFVDFWHRKHLFVAPVIAFDVGDATTVTIESLYTRNKLKGFFNGLPAEGTVLANPNGPLPRSLGLTDPTFAPSIRENSDISARVEHRFSERVKWRTAVSWTHEKTDEEGVFGLLGWEDEAKRTLSRAVLTSFSKGDNWTVHSDLGLNFETGPISHELVVGGDYTWFDRHNLSEVGLAAGLDVYAPVYELTARPETFPLPDFGSESDESTRTAGLFAQDRIAVTDRIKLIAGVRWSHYRQTVVTRQGTGDTGIDRQTQTAWTSQFGLLYTPVETISLFANRTTSFLPVQGVTADGSPLKPETGTQYEVGAKALLLGGRLSLNAALFHLKRGNVAVSDRDSPSALIAIGAQVAKGFELSASGRPVDGLTLYAGYAYTKANTTEDTNAALVGKRIRNIPRHSLAMRGDYELQSGALAGLALGGSATYTGDRAGDIDDSFELPGYWRFDAQAKYPLTENLTLGASVENIADKRYYSHAFSFFEIWPGAPRTWRLTLATRF
jgi:iron complex outermembrane recepter protein